ncbi:MAG: hypothetical protein GX891_03065 [Clostridiales bacterium]|nr:hypothetical protein [Clostridiales bacterium]
MWENVMTQAMTNGIWACLFVALLVFVLKDGKAREERYLETLRTLSKSLTVVNEIKKDIGEILDILKEAAIEDKIKKQSPKAIRQKRAKADEADAEIHIEY